MHLISLVEIMMHICDVIFPNYQCHDGAPKRVPKRVSTWCIISYDDSASNSSSCSPSGDGWEKETEVLDWGRHRRSYRPFAKRYFRFTPGGRSGWQSTDSWTSNSKYQILISLWHELTSFTHDSRYGSCKWRQFVSYTNKDLIFWNCWFRNRSTVTRTYPRGWTGSNVLQRVYSLKNWNRK